MPLMRKKKYIIQGAICILILTWSSSMSAQPYNHSVGVRAGYSSGITYKGFFRHQMAAIEADVLYNRHGFNVSGLYEYHLEPFQNRRFLVYFGGGAFGGNWEGELSAGLTAIAGLEYNMRDLPLNFSIDWKPMLNAFRLFEIDLLDFGVSIRYHFNL